LYDFACRQSLEYICGDAAMSNRNGSLMSLVDDILFFDRFVVTYQA